MAPVPNLKRSLALVVMLASSGHTFVAPTGRREGGNRGNRLGAFGIDDGGGYGGGGFERGDGGGLGSLSVTELKRLLSERGIDFRDCLEKRDLIRRLLSTQAVGSADPYVLAKVADSDVGAEVVKKMGTGVGRRM